MNGDAAGDAGRDVAVPMVGCQEDEDCAPVGLPACNVTLRRCVECLGNEQCAPPHPVCDPVLSACVGCVVRTDCPPAAPACDPTTHSCVACANSSDCAAPTPLCNLTSHTCVECLPRTAAVGNGGTGGNAGSVRNAQMSACPAAKPICDPVNHTCAGCLARTDCAGSRPACDATTRLCVGCLAASDCTAPTAVCDGATKTCVGCLARTDCGAGTPACDSATKTCVGCLASSDCGGATAVCDVSVKTCVQCLTSADCPNSAPICDTKVCRACRSDAECVARSGANPGICMAHQDGRCALDSESIYVQNGSGCSMSATAATGGTAALPFCLSQLGLDALTTSRRLVVMRGPAALSYWSTAMAGGQPITVVGQNGATIAPGAFVGIHVTGALIFIRHLRVAGGASVGIAAQGGATLRLQHVVVDGNAGGGISLDGAAFSISNTVITNNGPGTSGAVSWGGVLVQNPPAAGPAQLNLVTLTTNRPVGLSCSAAITGTGVYSTGNTGGVEILPTCAVAPCAAPAASCGATP